MKEENNLSLHITINTDELKIYQRHGFAKSWKLEAYSEDIGFATDDFRDILQAIVETQLNIVNTTLIQQQAKKLCLNIHESFNK